MILNTPMPKAKHAKNLKSLIISAKKLTLDQIWEVPIFYKLLQATLAAGGHGIIKQYLLGQIPKGTKTILDQGCGTGEYSLLFGKKYTGLDYDPDYMAHARSRYPGTFIVGDAANMKDVKSNSFDVVFAVGLHHHLSDKKAEQAFAEGLRVTKKGGKMVVIDAMLPKHPLNFPGLILRKLDRGGNVRKVDDTRKLLPKNIKYEWGILSSFPFDYLTIVVNKK